LATLALPSAPPQLPQVLASGRAKKERFAEAVLEHTNKKKRRGGENS
jgi:hypothetical protein